MATPITIVLSYYLAIVTYRFGLDPDNPTVPIVTSVIDLAGWPAFSSLCRYLECCRMDDDEPKTVKELLVELKDASELMVDLAYAAGSSTRRSWPERSAGWKSG